jgi:hypothetical protein
MRVFKHAFEAFQRFQEKRSHCLRVSPVNGTVVGLAPSALR